MQELASAVALIDTRSLAELEQSRHTLRDYIAKQMHQDIDFGTIPGTKKPTLYKAGAEKLAKLFRLGARIIDKQREWDLEGGWAWFSYTVEVYHLDSGRVISQCEGSSNSKEGKNKNRPIADMLNTLQKMAQKRAFVGAVILGVGASDFYTQDMEDMPQGAVLSNGPKPLKPAAPAVVEQLPIGHVDTYVVPFGKFKGQHLDTIPFPELESYCNYILGEGEKKGVTRSHMSETVQEFLFQAEQYIFGTPAVPNKA